jgi:hypothetical protein
MRASLVVCAACLGACGGTEAPAFWRPWSEDPDLAEPASSDGGDPDAADLSVAARPDLTTPLEDLGHPSPQPDLASTDLSGVSAACSLAVSVTTKTTNGKYAPDNIGAIWVADAGDKFIKTLRVWAVRRQKHLDRWTAVTAAAGAPSSKVDAISSATLPNHGVRTATWSCTNLAGARVPDGSYRVCFELTESNTAGPLDCVPITLGPAPFLIKPADVSIFTQRSLELTR